MIGSYIQLTVFNVMQAADVFNSDTYNGSAKRAKTTTKSSTSARTRSHVFGAMSQEEMEEVIGGPNSSAFAQWDWLKMTRLAYTSSDDPEDVERYKKRLAAFDEKFPGLQNQLIEEERGRSDADIIKDYLVCLMRISVCVA